MIVINCESILLSIYNHLAATLSAIGVGGGGGGNIVDPIHDPTPQGAEEKAKELIKNHRSTFPSATFRLEATLYRGCKDMSEEIPMTSPENRAETSSPLVDWHTIL